RSRSDDRRPRRAPVAARSDRAGGEPMNVGSVMVFAVAAVPLLIAVGLVAAGISSLRRSRRDQARRTPVEAVVVEHSFMVQPAQVTFDYPVPGGWSRARRTVGLPVVRTDGIRVVPGDRLTVWVDPQDPGA